METFGAPRAAGGPLQSRGTERRAAGIPNPYLPGAKVPYIAAEWAGVCARPPRAPPPPLARGGRTMENPTGHSLTGAPLPPPRARLYFTRRQSVSFSRSPDTKRAAPLSIGGCRLRTPVMDCPSIPAAALFRQSGTVIVRLRMEPFHGRCCQATLCNATEYGRAVHRTPGCEQCARTRLISHYSDCDSDLVEKCRPYLRSSTARSRYVNVCAAICLLLLVGGLSPRCTAAPHRSRGMERQKRASDSTPENRLWANPCDYNNSNSKSAVKYSPKLAKDVASQARNALKSTAQYKDKFALKLHSYPSFDDLVQTWTGYDWLRKFPWFREEVLPKEKVLNQQVPDAYMNKLMDHIDEVLPSMYKGLKMVVAGLYAISNEGLNDNIISDKCLKEKINQTMHDVRAVLCLFNDIMKSRNLEIMPLPDSEIPDFKTQDKLSVGLLVYRDTLNYLEYLAQVFQKMYDKQD